MRGVTAPRLRVSFVAHRTDSLMSGYRKCLEFYTRLHFTIKQIKLLVIYR